MTTLALIAVLAVTTRAHAGANAAKSALDHVAVDEHLGKPVDRGLSFTDQDGRRVQLGDYLDGSHPLLLTLNYFRCRTLCDLQLTHIAAALRALGPDSARDVRVLTVSIDPLDDSAAAREKSRDLRRRAGGEVAWSFLVGPADASRALASELGFAYAYDRASDQYAHPAVLFVLSPQGKVVRYLYGLDNAAADLRYALIEASHGRIGRTLDRAMLSCFRYDEHAGRYTLSVLALVRFGGVLTVLAMLAFVLISQRGRRAERRP
jgi:protein SCO1/2